MGKLPGTWQGGRQGEALLTLGSLAKPESILRKHQETPLAGRGGPWVGGGEQGGGGWGSATYPASELFPHSNTSLVPFLSM